MKFITINIIPSQNLKMNKLLSVRKFVEYVVLPKMMARFYMKIKNYNYHQATQYLYG